MLDTLITPNTLKDLAGSTAYARGEDYFSAGAVDRLRVSGEKVSASVDGTETYRVQLWDNGKKLGFDCTCPRAAEGYFCKHCVAVGLAWLSEQDTGINSTGASGKKKRRDPWQDIRNYLAAQNPESLIAMVLDAAERDKRLYQSLLLKAERTGGDGNALPAFRKAIDGATRIRGFVDWREAGGFAANLDEVMESLHELLKPDTAAMLVELAEYAIERVDNAMQKIDDSNGEVGGILEALGELHIKACEMARPEPKALAERLFRLEVTQAIGLCSFYPSTYSDILGEAGLRRYRELAEAEWRKIGPKQSAGFDYHHSRIARMMESLAKASGNVEELVAIKARDLSLPYHYLEIAGIWTEAGQDNKALDWAERGLKAFPKETDNRLRDFLVNQYLQRRRNGEALQLTWVQFEEQPSLEHYKKLQRVAEQLGIWPEQRERALARLAETIAAGTAVTRWKREPSEPNQSLRIEIALWEEDYQAAWSAAHAGSCDLKLLVTLAGKLEAERADDAIALYKRIIPPIVEQTNNTAYADAVKLIGNIGKIMHSRKELREFGDYLAELRLRFKAKRNFIKLLDGLRPS